MRVWVFLLVLASSLFCEEPYYKSLFEEQLQGMQYLEVSQPPRLLFFSGTPGMGKSTLSKAIGERFSAVILNSDQARILFRENGFPREKLNEYLIYAIDRLQTEFANGRIVLDNTVDSCFSPYKTYLEKKHIPYTLIRLYAPREKVEERLSKREVNPEAYLEALDGWWKNYEVFGASEIFDLYFDNSLENAPVDPLFHSLESILRCDI